MSQYAKFIRSFIGQIVQGKSSEFLKSEWSSYLKRRRYRSFQKRIRKWQTYKLSKKESISLSIHGGIKINLFLDSELSRLIYLDRFEKSEQAFITRFLRKGDIFIDVGANIGLFSLIASKYVGKEGHVYAFEPCSKTHRRLCRNLKLARAANISCFPLGLSNENQSLDLRVSQDGFDAWNSFADPPINSLFKREAVQTIRWDDFVEQHSLIGKIRMMKIDVEGWEMRVLQGAEKTLSRSDAPVLQVEFTEKNCSANGYTCRDLYQYLKGLGYELFKYNAEENTLTPEPLRESYPHLNILALKDEPNVLGRIRQF